MKKIYLLALVVICGTILLTSHVVSAVTTQTGSVGVEGTIPTDPPTTGATITSPTNGQVFTETPITVSGLCPTGLLVKIFKNNVFAGSVMCTNGSYSIQIDLFSGQNDIVARVYDALDQAGPDSNIVSVTFNDSKAVPFNARVALTSNYAKRGANPGETLEWPITLSGGVGPYAILVDWGDGKVELISLSNPGEFTIRHIYEQAGIYNIIVKATDSQGTNAFLQIVGIANGAIAEGTGNDKEKIIVRIVYVWWPLILMFPLIFISFWLGKSYELRRLRNRSDNYTQ
jgi:hypothetical protein